MCVFLLFHLRCSPNRAAHPARKLAIITTGVVGDMHENAFETIPITRINLEVRTFCNEIVTTIVIEIIRLPNAAKLTHLGHAEAWPLRFDEGEFGDLVSIRI